MIRRGRDVEIYDTSEAENFGPLEGNSNTDRP
jgi:hypothetical protein